VPTGMRAHPPPRLPPVRRRRAPPSLSLTVAEVTQQILRQADHLDTPLTFTNSSATLGL
jgi:hypothetical protein